MEDQVARLMGDIPHVALDTLVRHPRLPEARKKYMDAFLNVYERDQGIARLLIEASRFLVFQVMVVLHVSHDPARPETWATMGRLKAALSAYGMASSRQIDAMVSRLRDLGYVEVTRSEEDARVRLVRPTELAGA